MFMEERENGLSNFQSSEEMRRRKGEEVMPCQIHADMQTRGGSLRRGGSRTMKLSLLCNAETTSS